MEKKLGFAKTQCGNYGNLLSHFFYKHFVKVVFLLDKSRSSRFHEIFFVDSEFLVFSHCAKSSMWKFEIFILQGFYVKLNFRSKWQ